MNNNAVLILGANSDMAKAIAIQYGKRGKQLVLAARDIQAVETFLNKENLTAQIVSFDALNPATYANLVEELETLPSISICCFGYLGENEKAIIDLEERDKILITNYNASVNLLSQVANRYVEHRSGTIVGISSVAGERGRASNFYYGSAKAGFTAFLSGLRNYGHSRGMHVVTVKPGFVKTKMITGMETKPSLTASPEQVAQKVIKAVDKKKNTIYVLGKWKLIMWVIRHLPESMFKSRDW